MQAGIVVSSVHVYGYKGCRNATYIRHTLILKNLYDDDWAWPLPFTSHQACAKVIKSNLCGLTKPVSY